MSLQKLSIYEAEERGKLFNLTLRHIFRENDVNGFKADKNSVYKDITKEDNTLTEEQIMIQNERHIEAQDKKLDSYTGGINAALSGSLLLIDDKMITISTVVDETANIKATTLANGIMSEDDIIASVK